MGVFVVSKYLLDMKIILKESQLKVISEKFKIESEDRIKLFENDDFLFVVPVTHKASCKYGANTKWCVTEKNDDDMFKRHYNLAGLGFLIIKNRELEDKLENEKFAFYINKPKSAEASKNPERILIYDEFGDIIPMKIFMNMIKESGIEQEIREIIKSFMGYTTQKFN